LPQDRLSQLVADRFAWICALWLHLALFAVLADFAIAPGTTPDRQAAVELEIVLPGDGRARPKIRQSSPVRTGDARLPQKPDNGSPDGLQKTEPRQKWIQASRLLAANALLEPNSRQARRALATLIGADRREQICALEAMEQLRQGKTGFRPTRLAPHAFKNSAVRGNMIRGTAGAVRSHRQWYRIAYRCRFDPEGRRVIGFEYALGAPVERALWEAHGLAPVH